MGDFHQNVRNGKEFITEVLEAVEDGALKEPFYPSDTRMAVSGWADRTYPVFPWKHCLQNSGCKTTALFYYMGEGVPVPRNPPYRSRKYRLLRESDR